MNNTTDDSWLEPNYPPSTINNILIWIYLLALVTTLVINSITVIVMVTTPKLRTHTNAFIVTLAVSDIIFSLYTIIINSDIEKTFYFSIDFKKFWRATIFAWDVQIHGYYGNLFLVSLERWTFIAKPFLYQRYVTTRAVIGSIAVSWVIPLVVNIPYLCIDPDSIWFYEVLTFTYINSVAHTVLFFVLLAIYTHICLITLGHLKQLPTTRNYDSQQTRRNSVRARARESLSLHVKNLKSVKLLIRICGIFFLCVSPHVYYNAYRTITDQMPDRIMYNGFLMLFALFHCSNFFVYALGIRLFRETLWNQCCRLCCCRGSHLIRCGNAESYRDLALNNY